MKNIPTLQGTWGSGETWDFYLSDTIPDETLVTCAFGFGYWDDKIMLTKTHRGWELPGGHIEAGETIIQGLHREMKEEAGAEVRSEKMLGYKRIENLKEYVNKATGLPYPKVSYMVYYFVTVDEKPGTHDGKECVDCGQFPLESKEVQESCNIELIQVLAKETTE